MHWRQLCLWLVFATALKAAPPNIIHIIGDDVGYDDLSCYGAKDIHTPNLDRLAAQGMRFTSFYAPSAVCTPTRAAILTGCYAQRVGLPTVLFPFSRVGLHSNEVTIAELLKTRGYSTALIGKWHLGHQPEFLPPNHGFDLFFGIPYPNDHGPERLGHAKSQGDPGFRLPPIPLLRGTNIVETPAQLASLPTRFTEEAVKFIEENKTRPFYLHFANIETHTPWLVPAQFQYESKAGIYGDAVQCLDWSVGEIMKMIDRLNLATNTLIVFTSDNGPLVRRYPELEGIYGHAATVQTNRARLLRDGKYQAAYEGGTRVAAIMRWPGRIPPGALCHELVAGFDLFPSFAIVAGAPLPAERMLDGRDISRLMFGDRAARSPHKAFYYYQAYQLAAVRSGQWKLVFSNPMALYDLESDISETTNLAERNPDLVQRLNALADEARADLGDVRQKREGRNRRPAGKL